MIFILTGCLAFIFFYIFDLNQIKLLKRSLNISFAAGIALLAASTTGILLGNYNGFQVFILLKILFWMLAIVSIFMMLYALFAALPFGETYIKVKKGRNVIDTGMYALCRHPGVIWFFLFYLFAWLASGKTLMMWAGIIWTLMDIIHVYIQDRWLFPRTLSGYRHYQNKVPFLLPSLASIKNCLSSLK
jgi:protein-S-isoprenylcysteine O-methyltransferase Ste14